MKVRIPNSGGNQMNAMLQQAQKMQADMEAMQAELETREYTAGAGGLVTVTVTGKHEIKQLKILPEALTEADGDPEMLEDLITVAFNEALSKAMQASEAEMGKLTNGMNLPGLL